MTIYILLVWQWSRLNDRERKSKRDYFIKPHFRQQKTLTKQHMSFEYLFLSSQIMSKTLTCQVPAVHTGFRRVIEHSHQQEWVTEPFICSCINRILEILALDRHLGLKTWPIFICIYLQTQHVISYTAFVVEKAIPGYGYLFKWIRETPVCGI